MILLNIAGDGTVGYSPVGPTIYPTRSELQLSSAGAKALWERSAHCRYIPATHDVAGAGNSRA